MQIALQPKMRKFVESQLKSGRYERADDVVAAALGRLMQDERAKSFAPGELRKLVAEGEADIARGDTVTLAEAGRLLRVRAKRSRR